jgi:fibronectin type 3 domain-containing protein
LSNTSIRLNWTDSTGETSYSFYRWNGAAWAFLASGAQNAITYTDNTIVTPGLYYYLVCANNSAGQACANYVSANNSVGNTPPTAPGNVTATPLSNTSIRLNWTDSTGETSYSFYRWNGAAWGYLAAGAQNSVVYTDSTIVTPGLYYYLVCANNSVGQTCAPYVSANNSVS